MSKRKQLTKLNKAIRHYFDNDGFDEGIARVDDTTLHELALYLSIEPLPQTKSELIKLLRRIWSESGAEARALIVHFFKMKNVLYISNKSKENPVEKGQKIEMLLEQLDISSEEEYLLYNEFITMRTKKISLSKMQSKLEHLRFIKKKGEIETRLNGVFDLEDAFEFSASIHYELFGETFHKIQPLKTCSFSYSFLSETPIEEIVEDIEQIKHDVVDEKQNELKTFLQTLEVNEYLTKDDIIDSLKHAQPSENFTRPALSEDVLFNIIERFVTINAISVTELEVIVDAIAYIELPYQEKPFEYLLSFSIEKSGFLTDIWQGRNLELLDIFNEQKNSFEKLFIQELDYLINVCEQDAKVLEYSEAQLYAKVYELLLPNLKNQLEISPKLFHKVKESFEKNVAFLLAKKRRQELTAKSIRDFKYLFDVARNMKRKLILHIGPTNSGKTYAAMQHLIKADTGYYLAPLRLLALEGFENLKEKGIESSLVTGEEQILSEDATHISSTIEMLNYDVDVDVCVIDEVQMIEDRDRGWAWANAIIGAPAKKIIMTGSPNARHAIEELAHYLGEELEIIEFERKNPLSLMEEAVDIDTIEPSSAIVAFSRKDVLSLKDELSQRYRVSVIYGNLSPEVRREEARRFRNGETEVLVSTDAIAMGLNLPIKTILFYKSDKFDGEMQRHLTPSEIHQIAGRAGRFGLEEKGYVGALNKNVLKTISKHFYELAKEITVPFMVMANLDHVKLIASILDETSLSEILNFFTKNMKFDGPFKAASFESMMEAAAVVDRYNVDLQTKFHLSCTPITTSSPYIMMAYERYVRSIEQKKPIAFIPPANLGSYAATTEQLLEAEDRVKEISMYLWLSYRFDGFFVDIQKAKQTKLMLNAYIERSLKQGNFLKHCRICSKALPRNFAYAICQSCYKKNFTRQESKHFQRR